MEKRLLITSTDQSDKAIEQVLKMIKPEYICLIQDLDGKFSLSDDLMEKIEWLIGDNLIYVKANLMDFHQVMDVTSEVVDMARAQGVEKIFVNVSPGSTPASLALYMSASVRGLEAVFAHKEAIKVPVIPYDDLPEQAIEILRVLLEDFDGRASLSELAERANVGRNRRRGRGRSKVALVDYYINKYLKPREYVNTEYDRRELYISLSEKGENLAKRSRDLTVFPVRMERAVEVKQDGA